MKITRKTLLKIGGATLASCVSFLYPGLSGLAQSSFSPRTSPKAESRSPSTIHTVEGDPTFAGGEVVEKTAGGVVVRSDRGARAIRIPAGTQVWKEVLVSADVVQLGDWLDVKGTPLPDGSLLARSEWIFVNIGRRNGVVVSASAKGLTIDHNKGRETLELSPALEVIWAKNGAAIPGGVSALVPGMRVGAVGLRLPNGGFRATRIWS